MRLLFVKPNRQLVNTIDVASIVPSTLLKQGNEALISGQDLISNTGTVLVWTHKAFKISILAKDLGPDHRDT